MQFNFRRRRFGIRGRRSGPVDPYVKAGRILLSVFIVYAVLVATNRGEFWPFSIYPMFSSAEQPWIQAVVRDVPADPAGKMPWIPVEMSQLPGDVVVLDERRVPANDVAALFQHSGRWTTPVADQLRALLGQAPSGGHAFVLFRVEEKRADEEKIRILCTPVAYLFPDSTRVNPAFDVQ